ncbi:MAG: hypothetical protein IJ791_06680 [Lachnospiraceae bacterium]|nr:hypothetical protein [Lachnospiraceae bacterium]
MSNALKRRENKARKRRNKKECNSWAYVILASIVDTIFSFSWHESQPEEPIFGLSDNLGPLGQKRQENLGMAILTLFFLAGIVATIYLRKQYPTEQRWTGALVLTGIVGVFMLIAWIMKKRGKK